MAQKVTSDKERKEYELSGKEKNIPFMQVDKSSDPISNFIANLRRQFMHAKGLGLGRLFGGKRADQQKQPVEPESIIGATKTVIRSDYKNAENNQTVQTNKKPALKVGNSNKMQQTYQKNKKPKLGL